MKIMVLQHAAKYHEARDWIHLQDQSILTYQSLLAHCRQLEVRCKQFQQAQEQGRAHLTSLASALASKSSIHTICNPIPSSPEIGVGITTHMDIVQALTENASTVTTPVTSQLYVESPIEAQ